MHSEMGPVRQNPIQRTVRTAHLSVLMTVHDFQYTIQLQTTIIAQMLSIGGEAGVLVRKLSSVREGKRSKGVIM